MALFARRERPPDELVEALPRDERVVSWADCQDGSVVAATPSGLWWPEPDAEHRLIGWQFVDKAIWREGELIIIQADVHDDVLLVDRDPVSTTLIVPRDLPPTVRSRVTGNIVKTEELGVGGGGLARFVARRIPGEDGYTWWARLERGAVYDDDTKAALTARLAILRTDRRAED